MKEFGEVMRQVFPEMDKPIVVLPAIGARYEHMVDEVRRDPQLRSLVQTMAHLQQANTITLESGLFSLFMNGLICGLEMSKE
jgi:hypothetical protein